MKEYFDKLYTLGQDEFYREVEKNINKQKRMFIVTSNPETFSYGQRDKEFDKLLKDKEVTLIPEGIGIVKASRMLNYDVKERITGIDLAVKLLEIANQKKLSVALLGAKEEVIESLKETLKVKYPNMIIKKVENGYKKDKDSFFKGLDVDICLVALGIPSQEKLIYKHINKFDKGIFVGVGGSFDVLSGVKKRAPKIIQKLNIEWLYRIIKEPQRIKRFYNNNIKFMFKIKKMK